MSNQYARNIWLNRLSAIYNLMSADTGNICRSSKLSADISEYRLLERGIIYKLNANWSKKKVANYDTSPAISLGYDNLLFPFVIIVGGIGIAGKDSKYLIHFYSCSTRCISQPLSKSNHLLVSSSLARW